MWRDVNFSSGSVAVGMLCRSRRSTDTNEEGAGNDDGEFLEDRAANQGHHILTPCSLRGFRGLVTDKCNPLSAQFLFLGEGRTIEKRLELVSCCNITDLTYTRYADWPFLGWVRELSRFTTSHDNLKESKDKDSGCVSVGWHISRRNLVFPKPFHPVRECVCCRTTDNGGLSSFPGTDRSHRRERKRPCLQLLGGCPN